MKKFRVRVREIYDIYVDVETESADEAYDIVDQQVEDGDISALNKWDKIDQDITVMRHPDDVERQIAEKGTVF